MFNTIQYNTIKVYCENTLSYNNGVLSQTEPKSGSVKARQLIYRYSFVFEERRKPEYLEKTSQSKRQNQKQTQPTYGVHAGPDWWDASAIPCFSLSYSKLARHDLPVPSVQIDSGVWSEVLD